MLAACCAAGAASTFGEKGSVEKMYAFGEKLGIAHYTTDRTF